ncbi:MAG: radical SAM protein [Candidatus Latescibacteria bacterium]|nr:radical SAM protein [Candidatus Latescibacterota bacterium]
MGLRILLVNPPICDFTAYDYWLKPYGLLRVAGQLRGQAELQLFDFLDRLHPAMPPGLKTDEWGRGAFPAEVLPKPAALAPIRRHYHRFGLPRQLLGEYLRTQPPFDAVLVQTTMTYWYPGVQEVIEEVRAASPRSAVVLGGVYATLCPAHARSLGANLVVEGRELEPLWQLLGVRGETAGLPYWEGYERLETGVVKLTEGCPFRCTYCSVPQLYPGFSGDVERTLAEIELLVRCGARRLAFYDDALLFQEEELLLPLLAELIRRGYGLELHTPNALNARFITPAVAELMVRAGFRSFYLGFESSAYTWQKKTGGKVYSADLVAAVAALEKAGADRRAITAYLIAGHPRGEQQEVEASMHFAHALGIRLMLSEFSPIPNTPDGEACREWVDLDEPLWHNKTAFAEHFLGSDELNRLKARCRHLNRALN